MTENTRPAPLSNNRIPNGLIWAFGLVFLALLLALPFTVHRVMSATRKQEQGLGLLSATGLPLDARNLRAAVRESRDKAAFAARYTLGPADMEKLRVALAPVSAPDSEHLAALEKLSPGESEWSPAPGAHGPWRFASGTGGETIWFALLDEASGTLWVHGERASR